MVVGSRKATKEKRLLSEALKLKQGAWQVERGGPGPSAEETAGARTRGEKCLVAPERVRGLPAG